MKYMLKEIDADFIPGQPCNAYNAVLALVGARIAAGYPGRKFLSINY